MYAKNGRVLRHSFEWLSGGIKTEEREGKKKRGSTKNSAYLTTCFPLSSSPHLCRMGAYNLQEYVQTSL